MSEKKTVGKAFVKDIIAKVLQRYFNKKSGIKYKFKPIMLKGNAITSTDKISIGKIRDILNSPEYKDLRDELEKLALKVLKANASVSSGGGGQKDPRNVKRINELLNALENPTDETRQIVNNILSRFDSFIEGVEVIERKTGSGRPKKIQPIAPPPSVSSSESEGSTESSSDESEETILRPSLTQDTSSGMSEIKSAVGELRKPSLKQQQKQATQEMKQKLQERQQMEERIGSGQMEVEVPVISNIPSAPSRGQVPSNIVGNDFRSSLSREEASQFARYIDSSTERKNIGARSLEYIRRLLSGEYSVGEVFNVPSLTQRQVVNIIAGLAILTSSGQVIPSKVSRVSDILVSALGTGVVARQVLPQFANAMDDFKPTGEIKKKSLKKVLKEPKREVKKELKEEPLGEPSISSGDITQEIKQVVGNIDRGIAAQIQNELPPLELTDNPQNNLRILRQMEEGEIAINFIRDPTTIVDTLMDLRNPENDQEIGRIFGNILIGLGGIGVAGATINRIRGLFTSTGQQFPPPSGTMAPVQTTQRPTSTTLAPPSTTLAPSSSTIAPSTTQPPASTLPPVPSFFTPRKIETFQQDTKEEQKSNQIAKPNYIIPSVSVLDPENQKEEFDIQAGFDFDIPFAMNGVVLEDNPLMQQHRMEEMIRYSGGGIWVGNEDWDDPTKVAFEKPANEDILPRMVFNEDYEDMPYNPNVSMETNIAYNDFTNVRPVDPQANSLRRSTLLGRQP